MGVAAPERGAPERPPAPLTAARDTERPDPGAAPSRGPGTRLRIIDATGDPAEEWDALAVRSPRGEALQSHAWGELKRATGWQPRRYRIVDEDGPIAVVSLQERPLVGGVFDRLPSPVRRLRGLGETAGRFVYAPAGPVLLRDGDDAARACLRALGRIARARNAALLVVDPEWPEDSPEAAALVASGFAPAARQIRVSRTAVILPLDRDEAAQRARLGRNVWRNVTRSRNAGVEVERIDDRTPEPEREAALRRFYDILEATGRRKGFQLRGPDYEIAAGRTLIVAGHASLWFARVEGTDLAADLIHHCGRRILGFQAGEPDAAGRNKLPANFLLQWEIMRWAADAGFEAYDMGGVDTHVHHGLPQDESHPMWNLYRYKLRWGAYAEIRVGAYDFAPRRPLGWAVRSAWRASDALRRVRARR